MMTSETMSWNSILVCLDLSITDQVIVEFAANLALNVEGLKKVVLLHNIRFDFAGVTPSFSQADIERLRRKIKKRLSETYKANFNPSTIAFDVVVADENSTTKAILNEANRRRSSVILMGKKNNSEGMGIIPQKVLATDQKQTPLLLIPSEATFSIKKIVAAVDLSNTTRKVVEAVKVLEQELLSAITLFHVYKVPINYFPYLETSNEELSATLKQRATKRMQQFQSELSVPNNNWQTVTRKSTNVSEAIINFIDQQEADLLVVGRLGKTNLFRNNIGGVVRALLVTDLRIPICIV